MRRVIRLLFVILAAQTLVGCTSSLVLARVQRMDRQAKIDRIRSYEQISDAYRILAYEYYKLATDAENRKQTEQAKDYAARVSLYDSFYKRLRNIAQQMRAELQAQGQADAASRTERGGSAGARSTSAPLAARPAGPPALTAPR